MNHSALPGILVALVFTMVGAADAACDTFGPIKRDPLGDTAPVNDQSSLGAYDIVKMRACYDSAADEYVYTITTAQAADLPLFGSWFVNIGSGGSPVNFVVAEVYREGTSHQFRLLAHYDHPSFSGYLCEATIRGSVNNKTFRLRVSRSQLDALLSGFDDYLADYTGGTGVYLLNPPSTNCSRSSFFGIDEAS